MKFISTFVFVSVAVSISIKDLGRDNTSPRSVQEIEDESIKDGTMVFSGDEDFVNTKSFYQDFYQDDSEKIALNQNFFSQLGHSGLVKMTKRDPVDPSQNPRQSVETRIQILFDKMKPFKADVAVNPRKLETLYPKLKNELLQLNDEIEQTIENGSPLTEEQLSQFTDLSTIFEMMELNSEMRNAGCVDQMSLIFGSEPRKTKLIDVMEKFDRFSDHLSQCYDDDKNPKILDPHFETLVQSCISDLGNLKEESKDFINQDTPLSTAFNEELADIQIEIDTLKDLTGARTATPIHSTNTGNSQGSSQFQEEKSLSEAEKAQQHELEELETKLRSAFTGNYQNEGSSDLQNSLQWRKRLQKACDEVFLKLATTEFPDCPRKKDIEELLKESIRELSRKVNSILLLATAICSDGMEPDLDSLKTFSGLQTIMKHDFEYVNSKVKKVIEELQKIDDVLTDQNSYDSRRSSENEHSFEDLKTMIQVQRKILDRISQYMEESLWVTLSDGDTIRDNGRLAYAMLNNVDSFLNGHDTVD